MCCEGGQKFVLTYKMNRIHPILLACFIVNHPSFLGPYSYPFLTENRDGIA